MRHVILRSCETGELATNDILNYSPSTSSTSSSSSTCNPNQILEEDNENGESTHSESFKAPPKVNV